MDYTVSHLVKVDYRGARIFSNVNLFLGLIVSTIVTLLDCPFTQLLADQIIKYYKMK